MLRKPAKSFTVDELRSLEDPSFLNHKVRKDSLRPPKLAEVLNGRVAHFKAPSSKNNGTNYDVYVMFPEMADKAVREGLTAEEAVDLVIKAGDVKVSCSCPAFLYWGYKYIDTTLKSQHGNPETRFPELRNPDERGVFCKHIGKCLDHLNWTKYESLKPPFIEYVQKAINADVELEGQGSNPVEDDLVFDAETPPTPSTESDDTPVVEEVLEEGMEEAVKPEAGE